MVRSTSLRSGTGHDDRRPGGRTTYRMDFIANQLVGLLGTHSCSVFTSPPTSWLDCSSHGFHSQLCWDSPATLGIPWCSDSSCKRRQLSWGLPWWSDLAMSHRCSIKLLHAVWIRVLILGSKSRVLIRASQMTSASFQTSFL